MPSVGSVGDSYDNALAETVIGLFKTEVIRRLGPGATSTPSSSPHWMGRLVQPSPPARADRQRAPAEAEQRYYAELETRAMAA